MQQAPWIAKNFITNGRPLFNEKAYKILVNQGHGDRARRQYYNKPENALKMTIKGPAGDEQAYVDAFNEVFGAKSMESTATTAPAGRCGGGSRLRGVSCLVQYAGFLPALVLFGRVLRRRRSG